MDVWLVVVIGFSASKYDLEAETPTRHRCYRNRHGVKELAVVFLVVVCVFASYPALKVRNIALQKSHKPSVVVGDPPVRIKVIFLVRPERHEAALPEAKKCLR